MGLFDVEPTRAELDRLDVIDAGEHTFPMADVEAIFGQRQVGRIR